MKSGVIVTEDHSREILEALRSIKSQQVLVGVPEGKDAREDSTIGNAQIGYQNEFGSPALNIPPRPHLVPGVESSLSQTIPLMNKAATAAIAGDHTAVSSYMNQAGIVAVGKVQSYIQNANFVPLSTKTIEERAKKGRAGAQQELDYRMINGFTPSENSNDLARPLIDTGSYIHSITYVVEDGHGSTSS